MNEYLVLALRHTRSKDAGYLTCWFVANTRDARAYVIGGAPTHRQFMWRDYLTDVIADAARFDMRDVHHEQARIHDGREYIAVDPAVVGALALGYPKLQHTAKIIRELKASTAHHRHLFHRMEPGRLIGASVTLTQRAVKSLRLEDPEMYLTHQAQVVEADKAGCRLRFPNGREVFAAWSKVRFAKPQLALDLGGGRAEPPNG